MKIETTPRDDQQVRIVAEFEPEFMEKYKQSAARKISQETRIPGFRPGKAPYAIVRRMFGDEAIEKEAVELMLDNVYPDVLKEAAIEPSGPGNLEEIISHNPPKFAFVVPLKPKVELGDYHSIRKEYTPPEVTEEQIDQVIKNLRGNYSTAEPVERPVQEGDLVSVKVSGVVVHPAEGEEPEIFKENIYQMIVGENEFEEDDWPYVGFTRELVGMNAKEEKNLTHSYPADYVEEKLKGKEVNIQYSVIDVKSLKLPELNDEFAQSLGEYADVAALRDSIRKNLEQNNQREYENEYFTNLVDQVVSISDIKYPPQILQDEMERVLHSLEHDLEDRRMDLPTYLKTLNKERDVFIEENIKPMAKRRLERSLVLDQIASAEKIQLDPEELQREVEATMKELQSEPAVSKLRGEQAQNFAQNLTLETASRILNRSVNQFMKNIATGQAETIDATTSIAEAPAAPEATITEASATETAEPAAETPAGEPPAAEKPAKTPRKRVSKQK